MVPFLQLLLYTHTHTRTHTTYTNILIRPSGIFSVLCGCHCLRGFYFPVNFEWRATFLTRLSFQSEDLGIGEEFEKKKRQGKRDL